MANKTLYALVGRYMKGSEIEAYHLQSIDTGKSGKFSKEQLCYLIGRGQVTNCTAQLYKDSVLIRGNGIEISSLPVVRTGEDGSYTVSNSQNNRKRITEQQALDSLTVIARVDNGQKKYGYLVQNYGGVRRAVTKEQLTELASRGIVTNARVQQYNGAPLLRAYGCKFGDLPVVQLSQCV